ncbi:hypothetical protein [Endozoicomonas lisbonensis]|uniref:hypothetical protein n=1 Tax=Endozoicomonas lisbonensis TaxID=3120522 RepID=UPI0033926E75
MAEVYIEPWPAVFPSPKINTQFTCADNRQQSDGDFAQRSDVFDANYCETVSASFVMNCRQFELFRSWYRWRLFNGVGVFAVNWGRRNGVGRFASGWSMRRTAADRIELSAAIEVDYAISG